MLLNGVLDHQSPDHPRAHEMIKIQGLPDYSFDDADGDGGADARCTWQSSRVHDCCRRVLNGQYPSASKAADAHSTPAPNVCYYVSGAVDGRIERLLGPAARAAAAPAPTNEKEEWSQSQPPLTLAPPA